MFVIRQLPAIITMGIYKAEKSVDIYSKMMPPSLIALLTLCAFLTEIHPTSGYIIKPPKGQCPPVIPGIRCTNHGPSDCGICKWNEKCCYNGCINLCMRVSSGASSGLFDPIIEEKPFPAIPDHLKPGYAIPDPLPPQPELKPWDPFNSYNVPEYDNPPFFPGGYNFP